MGFLLESPVQIVRFSHSYLSTRRGALQILVNSSRPFDTLAFGSSGPLGPHSHPTTKARDTSRRLTERVWSVVVRCSRPQQLRSRRRGTFLLLKVDYKPAGSFKPARFGFCPEAPMDNTTLLVLLIVIVVLAGGFYGRRRWF